MRRTEAGWPSAKQTVKHQSQASAADFISVAGHSLGCTKQIWTLRGNRQAINRLDDPQEPQPAAITLRNVVFPSPLSA